MKSKTPSDSVCVNTEIVLPNDTNVLGNLMGGRLLHWMDICAAVGIPAGERRLSISEIYSADEVFTSGTMGELTPVLQADGRVIGSGQRGPMTQRLQKLHRDYAYEHGTPVPFT